VVVLLAAAWGGWRYGGEIFPRIERWVAAPPAASTAGSPPSRQIADDALDRFNTFRTAGLADSTLRLSALELTSIVRYSLPELMPEGIREPTVEFEDDRVVLSARVARAAFPEVPGIQEVAGLLPDTVRIRMRSTLLRLDQNHAALVFDGVEASGIPLPDRVIPSILASLGRTERPGLPSSALAVPLPSGIGSAYMADGSLVFVSTE
jgi:hypothetical protein